MSDARPSVSVVITCYNYERYVGACVRSVLLQTLQAHEVIVVDDGSTDGSATVLADFGDRITVIAQENSGLVPARNRGFAACRGGLVLFLDADDMLHPEALEGVVCSWMPGCSKVQFDLEVIDSEGARTGRLICNYVKPYGARQVREEFSAFGTYLWPVSSGNAYSRSYLKQLFPLTVSWGPDGVLNTLAPLYGDVVVLHRVLGYYRLHGANNSHHGSSSGALGRRLAKRVEIRSGELRLLAQHAAARGRALPPGNVLDRELPFVNYRIMLKRLGEKYEGHAADTPVRLWWAGMTFLFVRPLPRRLKVAHGVWLTVMLCAPHWLCRLLIPLRFNPDFLHRLSRLLAPIPRGLSARRASAP
jgi:glycosyltransferase involved in cell wall biosynthesis